MLDTVAELVLELGFDRLVERDGNRTIVRQICLFLGVVFVLLGIALAAVSVPWYGLAVGFVGLVLLLYGA